MSNNRAISGHLQAAMEVVTRCRREGEAAACELGEQAQCPYNMRRQSLQHAGWMDGWSRALGKKKSPRAHAGSEP